MNNKHHRDFGGASFFASLNITVDPTTSQFIASVDWADTYEQFLEDWKKFSEKRQQQVADAREVVEILSVDTRNLDELSDYQYKCLLKMCRLYGR